MFLTGRLSEYQGSRQGVVSKTEFRYFWAPIYVPGFIFWINIKFGSLELFLL